MIERYSREAMNRVWSDPARFAQMLRVELECQRHLAPHVSVDLRPHAESNALALARLFSLLFESPFSPPTVAALQWVERIRHNETTTRHETLAFLQAIEETLPELNSRLLHLGLTSSDVLDTALALQLREAGLLIRSELEVVISHLELLSETHSRTLMCGRTHGMVAEPTTFGFKMAGFVQEFKRHLARLDRAIREISVGKISGAIGTSQFFGPEYEMAVLEALALQREPFATQVVCRDRHAAFIATLAVLGGGIERLAVELRHLQRSEVAEVHEGFSRGQTGSSAMPHKKNPISSENLSGCSRLLRSYALASLENQALWHERDMSHSSVERVILPDACIIADYALDRLSGILKSLVVDRIRMVSTLKSNATLAFSSQRLFESLAASDSFATRQSVYEQVQRESFEQGSHALAEDEWNQRSTRVLDAIQRVFEFNSQMKRKET